MSLLGFDGVITCESSAPESLHHREDGECTVLYVRSGGETKHSEPERGLRDGEIEKNRRRGACLCTGCVQWCLFSVCSKRAARERDKHRGQKKIFFLEKEERHVVVLCECVRRVFCHTSHKWGEKN